MSAGADGDFRAATTRERVLAAGARLTADIGWSQVTMARLADAVGVSRQTVHNEVGTKAGLAEAMILRELARFLDVVSASFDAHPDDLVAAIRRSCADVLGYAHDNHLLKAIVSATHGADTELLPLLTTHSASLLATAKVVLADRIAPYRIGLSPDRLDAAIDMVVRVILSHVMQPSADPDRTADDVAWIAARVLG